MCIVDFSRVSNDEAKAIYMMLQGVIYAVDGTIKKLDANIIVCAPRNFIVDGDIE